MFLNVKYVVEPIFIDTKTVLLACLPSDAQEKLFFQFSL